MSRTPTIVALLIVAGFAGVLAACGAGSGTTANPSADAQAADSTPVGPLYPPITIPQAGEAFSDAMLVASQALYTALAAGRSASGRVQSADGRLTLSWSDDANFMTGAGRYTIVLDGYAIAPDDAFAAHSYGYALSGSITLESPDGQETTMVVDLVSSHADPTRYPVERVEMRSGGAPGGDRDDGEVTVNGQRFALADLTSIFED